MMLVLGINCDGTVKVYSTFTRSVWKRGLPADRLSLAREEALDWTVGNADRKGGTLTFRQMIEEARRTHG
jgi:hypothetical protein